MGAGLSSTWGHMSSVLSMGVMGRLVEMEGGFWRAGGAGATVIGHGENGNLCDGATPTLHTASSLIDGGQVRVHISREATATWHFLSGSRDLQYPQQHICQKVKGWTQERRLGGWTERQKRSARPVCD